MDVITSHFATALYNIIMPPKRHNYLFDPGMKEQSHNSCRVSVVVATYRRPQLLKRCIDAIASQDFPVELFELIIVSDGPDAESATVVKEYFAVKHPRIRFLSLSRKRGPAAARNFGWVHAYGTLIAFTDDDCIPHKGWLAALYAAFQDSSVEKIAFAGNTVVPVAPYPTDYERNIAHLAEAEFITANCACTKKALFAVAGLDERFTMAWREDSDLQFKFIEHGIPIVKVDKAIITHPVRKAPWGVSIREERKGIFNALLFKKYPRLYKERIQPEPPWHYYLMTFLLFVFVFSMAGNKSFLTKASLAGWLFLTGGFVIRRLESTDHSWKHVSEMIVTSAVIPILSLYWRYYGNWKFRTLLIP
jgi:glycosyltransferase involved in cell wall biosynthesis